MIFSIFTEQPSPLARTFSSPWKLTLYPLTVASHSPNSSFWQPLIYFLSLWTCWFQTCGARIRVFEAGLVTFWSRFWVTFKGISDTCRWLILCLYFFKNSFIYLAAPSLSCGTWDLSLWPPRPTQSSGNAPSSPVEYDGQGCSQAGVGKGFSKVSVGNPSQKHRKRCMFRHKSSKTVSGSGSKMGLLLAAWRRRGSTWRWLIPLCPCLLPSLTPHLEVLWVPSLPLPGRGVDQETPEEGRGLWGEPTLQRQWGWDWPGPTDASSAVI